MKKLTRDDLWKMYGHNYTDLSSIEQVQALNNVCRMYGVDDIVPIDREELPNHKRREPSLLKGRQKEAMDTAWQLYPKGPAYERWSCYKSLIGENSDG